MRRLLMTLAVVAAAAGARAGEPQSCVLLRGKMPEARLSGNARIDFSMLTDPVNAFPEGPAAASAAATKSPWLAAGLSLVIPGAGEFYSESYLKSAVFFAAEAALWVLAYTYDQKGNRQTDFFQNYANSHWNVVNYAQYALTHYASSGGNYQVILPGTAGDPPWMRINWSELNRMELDIGLTGPGSFYSHVLPQYNSQQYYELIGKYPQFNQGWDDAPPAFAYGGQRSSEALYYDGERGKANNFYSTASTFVAITFVNHVASAIDAALTAGSYNRGLHAAVGSQTIPANGGYATVPVLHLTWGF